MLHLQGNTTIRRPAAGTYKTTVGRVGGFVCQSTAPGTGTGGYYKFFGARLLQGERFEINIYQIHAEYPVLWTGMNAKIFVV